MSELRVNRVYLEDCLKTMGNMPDGFVDLVVTSPPYNLNKKASGGGNSRPDRQYVDWYPDDMPEQDYQVWQRQVITECLRVSKNGMFYNHRVRYAWHSRNTYRTRSKIYHPMDWLRDFPIWCEIVWDRGGTSSHANGRCRLSDERIYQIGKPTIFHDLGLTTVWKITPTRNTGHVCSFPDELVRRCILLGSDEGDLIYDPFMGVGTTARVAVETGRLYLGSEISKEYYLKARETMRLLRASL